MVVAWLALSLAACSTGTQIVVSPPGGSAAASDTPGPGSTPTFRPSVDASIGSPPSPWPSLAAPSVGICDIFDTLLQVDELLAGQTYQAHFLTIGGRMSISIWLVDRAIDPATTAAGLGAANREAISTGLAISYRVIDRIPCARRVFEIVNPMIVDSRYQGWYSDFIPVEAFTDLHDPTTDQLIEAADRVGTPPAGRAQPPVSPSPAAGATGRCSWKQARDRIAVLQGNGRRNRAAYVIVDGGRVAGSRGSGSGDVDVEVQWDVDDRAEIDDQVTLRRLGWIADALACLSPRVGQLEFYVVDPAGELVVYARVSGSLIKPGGGPLARASIFLRHTPSKALP